MDDATRTALSRSQVIDLTTTGRRTGQQRRIEIFLHSVNGQLYPAERRPLIEAAATAWGRTDIDVMLEHSPLIEVTIEP